MKKCALSFGVLAAAAIGGGSVVSAFAPSSVICKKTTQPVFPATAFSSPLFSTATPSASSAASIDASSSSSHTINDDLILKEFEKKEAKIQKAREAAMAKLSEFEESLAKLQSKKQEYLAASQMATPPIGGTFSETTLRSAVKALMWRVIAGSVTFVTTLQFSKSMTMALQVVMGDFFSKALTMFIGERLMNKSKAGRNSGSDGIGRSLAKALIWRLFAICNTLCMAVFISKDLSVASKIASTDAVFKTGLMFFYERAWARIPWGKEYLIEYAI